MSESCLLNELKIEIEDKRRELDRLIVSEMDRDEILKFSMELDKLIGKYYNLELSEEIYS